MVIVMVMKTNIKDKEDGLVLFPTKNKYTMNTLNLSEIYLEIHRAIHSDKKSIMINNVEYPVILAPNGCRRVTFNNIAFMEQNKGKNSSYAKSALEGRKITWGIRDFQKWIYIHDDIVED